MPACSPIANSMTRSALMAIAANTWLTAARPLMASPNRQTAAFAPFLVSGVGWEHRKHGRGGTHCPGAGAPRTPRRGASISEEVDANDDPAIRAQRLRLDHQHRTRAAANEALDGCSAEKFGRLVAMNSHDQPGTHFRRDIGYVPVIAAKNDLDRRSDCISARHRCDMLCNQCTRLIGQPVGQPRRQICINNVQDREGRAGRPRHSDSALHRTVRPSGEIGRHKHPRTRGEWAFVCHCPSSRQRSERQFHYAAAKRQTIGTQRTIDRAVRWTTGTAEINCAGHATNSLRQIKKTRTGQQLDPGASGRWLPLNRLAPNLALPNQKAAFRRRQPFDGRQKPLS